MIIGIDIDQTIVNTNVLWSERVWDKYKITKWEDDKFVDFWKNPKLYDNLIPFSEAVSCINNLSYDNTIIFISACFDEHLISKFNFIARNFNFDGFINEHQKEKYDGWLDYMIDDRSVILNKFKNTRTFKISSTMEPDNTVVSWPEINRCLGGQ